MAQVQLHYPQSARRLRAVSHLRHEFEQVMFIREECQTSAPGNPRPRNKHELHSGSNSQPTSSRNPPLKPKILKNVSNSAPAKTDCLFYVARDVILDYRHVSFVSNPFEINEFSGRTSRNDVLPLDFVLFYDNESRYFDLRISDTMPDHPGKKPSLCLSRFQQAEIILQFLTKAKDTNICNVIHEEPPIKISLDLPNGRRLNNEMSGDGQKSSEMDRVTVICRKVLPFDAIETPFKPPSMLMKFEMKLMKGESNVLHGIQKSFSPDKSLLDLKIKMESMLVDGMGTDTVVICGDGVKYRAHQSVLCANSEVYKAMFASNMKESRTRTVHTPDYVGSGELEAILKYMYGRNCFDLQQCPKLTTNVLRAAHEHQMMLLMETCEESILGMPSSVFNLKSILYVFHAACLLDKLAIQTKCVHLILEMDLKLSKSDVYMEFLQRHTEVAAKLTDMIVHFQKHLSEKK